MEKTPEFKANFKIPLKNDSNEATITMTSPVDLASCGIGYDPSEILRQQMGAAGGWWGQTGFSFPQIVPPPPAPTVISAPPALNANGIKRKIDKDMMSELNDPSLPKELTAMFQPLYCKLCAMHLNSSSNAKLHYLSKNHQKKVRKFLIEYSVKTGEPLHKKAKTVIKNKVPDDPKYSHCSVCDLQLTSKLHAEQHYMGKNHQKAASKKNKPAGSGYYDEQGNWHRTEKQTLVDTTGRFGIGMAFASPEEIQVAAAAAAAATTTTTPTTPTQSKYFCDLCKISTTSAEHLQMHINGQKHQKLLKRNPATQIQDDPFGDLEAVTSKDNVFPKDNILNSVKNESTTNKTDYSVYRTPSGWYYCQLCNVTVNSEAQFIKHLESKKHLKKKSSAPIQK